MAQKTKADFPGSPYWSGLDLARPPGPRSRPDPGAPRLAPQLEKTNKTPLSSRDEGLLFLHGLESNPESSLQTPQGA